MLIRKLISNLEKLEEFEYLLREDIKENFKVFAEDISTLEDTLRAIDNVAKERYSQTPHEINNNYKEFDTTNEITINYEKSEPLYEFYTNDNGDVYYKVEPDTIIDILKVIRQNQVRIETIHMSGTTFGYINHEQLKSSKAEIKRFDMYDRKHCNFYINFYSTQIIIDDRVTDFYLEINR